MTETNATIRDALINAAHAAAVWADDTDLCHFCGRGMVGNADVHDVDCPLKPLEGVDPKQVADVLAAMRAQNAEVARLRAHLEFFSDEGHYDDTYRRGRARAALDGTWCDARTSECGRPSEHKR